MSFLPFASPFCLKTGERSERVWHGEASGETPHSGARVALKDLWFQNMQHRQGSSY